MEKEEEEKGKKMIKEGVQMLKALRNEHLPRMKDDIVILSSKEYDVLLESNDPNNQVARLMKTMHKVFNETRGSRPVLLFEGDHFIAKDKYYSKYQSKSKSIITALTNYIEFMQENRRPMSDAGVDNSKYKYFFPPTVNLEFSEEPDIENPEAEEPEEAKVN